MAHHRSDLFKWQRKTDPLEIARRGKKDKMKEWIKKVQDASERAAVEAYGSDIFGASCPTEIIPDDEALYEAQELLDGWLEEKPFPNLKQELDFKNENWSSNDRLILDADTYLHDNDYLSDFRNKFLGMDNEKTYVKHYSPVVTPVAPDYADFLMDSENINNDDIDDSLAVQEVLRGMMSKQVVENIDLGMKPLVKKVKNPLPKMNLRHQQVKRQGTERKQRIAAKKLQQSTQKEIEQKARERIIEEEKQKKMKEKADEKYIRLEMIRIRKEMEEEKRKQFEESERKQKILDEAKLQMQEELRRKKKEREKKQRRRLEAEEKMRLHIKKEIEEKSLTEWKLNMQILHKHFSLWYNTVLETRLKVGKARAVADWKCKLKAWNAWKSYVSCVRSSEEARTIEQTMKEKYRKEQMAINYNNKKHLHLCFKFWLKYTRCQIEKKVLTAEHEKKAKKMAMFLEAAARGLLWNDEKRKSSLPTGDENVSLKDDNHKKKCRKTLYEKQQTNQQRKQQKEKEREERLPPQQVKQHQKHNQSKIGDIDGEKYRCVSQALSPTLNAEDNLRNGNRHQDRRSFPEVQETDQNMKDDVITGRSDMFSAASTVSSGRPYVRSQKQTTKPLHLAMEERENERKQRKAQVEEKKRKKEEEKLKELRDREAARLQREEEEKEERIRQKKEQRRIEIQKEKEKQLRLEQVRIQTSLATTHFQNNLLRKYGVEPLKRLTQIAKLNVQISDTYRNGKLLRLVLIEWQLWTKEILMEKKEIADRCYKRILLKRSLRSWQKVRFHLQSLTKIARKHNLVRIKKHAFNAWQDYVTDERILMWAKESTADEHNHNRMLKTYLHAWKRYVSVEKEERIRETRKNELRKKVQQWLPDFKRVSAIEEKRR